MNREYVSTVWAPEAELLGLEELFYAFFFDFLEVSDEVCVVAFGVALGEVHEVLAGHVEAFVA